MGTPGRRLLIELEVILDLRPYLLVVADLEDVPESARSRLCHRFLMRGGDP